MVQPSSELLAELRDLHERGLSLQAFERARELGPLTSWRRTEARVLAGRLAAQWGATRLTRILHSRAFRDDPQSPEARYYNGFDLLASRGWYRAWQFVQETPDLTAANADIRSSWLCLRARLTALFRDFDAAEQLLDRAEDLHPESVWVWAERSGIFEQEDRYDEALAASQRSLAMRPRYRPALQQTAHLLTLQQRDAEAIDLLQNALDHIEASPIAAQLSLYLMELGRFEESRRWLERFAELTPLRDKPTEKWLAGRRGDLAYELGDIDGCVTWSKLADTKFHKHVVERLESQSSTTNDANNGLGRVLLPVGFVRQHQLTCAPATLTTISRFWQRPAEHLAIAELICYDGTPRIRGREWAEQNGYVLREFRVTWDSAKGLLDRGIPFALTTVGTGNAHMQAVVGYDERRGTLLLRDPFVRLLSEALGDELLKQQRPFGPRGMAFVPHDRPELVAALNELDLPDTELNEQNHRLEAALKGHRRDEAQQACDEMRRLAADDPMTILAQRELARYDGDTAALLGFDNQMLAQFEDQPAFVLSKLSLLRDLARRDERLDLCRRMIAKEAPHPEFWSQLGQLLSDDARQHDEAQFWLRRALRASPSDAGNYFILANIRWTQRRFEEAYELYRQASGLNERSEALADSSFRAARFLRQTDSALDSLRRRFDRFGKKSSLPAQTLFWAYSALERTDEAFGLLREALELRPEDAELKLFTAEVALQGGRIEWAAELLAQTEGKAARLAWLMASARQAEFHGDLPRALAAWREVAAADPLAVGTQMRVADLLAEVAGPAAALAHFRQLTKRFPYHLGLHQVYVSRLRNEAPDRVEPIVRHLVEVHPFDAWSHRELAITHKDRQDFEAAFQELNIAEQCNPHDVTNFVVRGGVLQDAGRPEEAREAFRQAIRLSIDNDYAIGSLLSLCDSTAQRREELQFIWQEMVVQVLFGDGLLAFAEQAHGTFEPAELLVMLREALAARPDLWHAWSAVIVQLSEMNRLDEALELATQATERFPLLPKLWLDLAMVQQHRHDTGAEQAALRRALEINPNWALAARRLAESFERGHQLNEARELLEGMARRAPLDGGVLMELTDLLWVQGQPEEAVARLETLLRTQPGYEAAWARLHQRTDELKQPERFEKLVREIVAARPMEPRTWLIVARYLSKPEQLTERLAALDRVIEMRPLLTEAYDLRAELLVSAHRYEEALAACRPAAIPGRPPFNLRGRAAWVEWCRGRADEAVRLMQDVLVEYGDYLWGRRILADWAVETSNWPLARETAEKLLAMSPHDNVAWGYLGDAKERTNDIDGAIECYENALSLCPDYSFAGNRLFELRLGKKHFHQAEKTLDQMRLHVGGPAIEARAVQLEFARGERAVAREKLTALCRQTDIPDWSFDPALQALRDSEGHDNACLFLKNLVLSGQAHPAIAGTWVRWSFGTSHAATPKFIGELLAFGELGTRAVQGYCEVLSNAYQPKRLKKFARQYRPSLRQATATWAFVGWALAKVECYADAAHWLSDWRDRTELESWMLANLVQSLRGIDRDSEAAEVSRHALTLPIDVGTRMHEMWLIADAYCVGDALAARELLAPMDPHGLHTDDQFLWHVLTAVLSAERSDSTIKPATLFEIQQKITAARLRYRLSRRTPPYRAAYRRILRRFAQRHTAASWWCRLHIGLCHLHEALDVLQRPFSIRARLLE